MAGFYLMHIPGWLRLPAMVLFLAWRNLWRNPVRTGLTATAMAVALIVMIVTAALQEGMIRKMIAAATRLNVGHLQVHRRGFIDNRELYALLPSALLEHLRRETPYAYAPRAYAAGLAGAGDFSAGVLLKGIEPAEESLVTAIHQHLRRGRFDLSRRPSSENGTGEAPVYSVLIGAQVARALRVGVGAELVLITQAADGSIGNGLFRVAGIMKPIEPVFDRAGVLLSMEAFQSLMFLPDGVHELAVAVADPDRLGEIRAEIASAVASWPGELPDGESGPAVVRRWEDIFPALADVLRLSRTAMLVITFLIFALVALGLVNTVLMSIHERRWEFGILLAMGMGRLRVLGMVLTESLLLAVFSAVVGALLGFLWALYLERNGLDFTDLLPDGFDWGGLTIELVYNAHPTITHVMTSVAVMLLTVMVAALIPSWRTLRLRPAEGMHL